MPVIFFQPDKSGWCRNVKQHYVLKIPSRRELGFMIFRGKERERSSTNTIVESTQVCWTQLEAREGSRMAVFSASALTIASSALLNNVFRALSCFSFQRRAHL